MVSSRAFANKIWNAARFIFLQMEKLGVERFSLENAPAPVETLEDQWIFHRLNETTARIHKAQENYRYHEVADLLYGFFWDEFCDWYVELKKLRINTAATPEAAHAHLDHLLRVFETALRLLHPVMPFLTEELWQRLVEKSENTAESICLAAFPQANPVHENETAAAGFALLQEIVVDQRALRADNKIDPKLCVEALIRPLSDRAAALVAAELAVLDHLTTNHNEIADSELAESAARSKNEYQTALKLSGAQAGAMRQRLVKEIEQLEKVIASSKKQLGSEAFTAKAPAHVVESIRSKLSEYEAQLEKSQAALSGLGA